MCKKCIMAGVFVVLIKLGGIEDIMAFSGIPNEELELLLPDGESFGENEQKKESLQGIIGIQGNEINQNRKDEQDIDNIKENNDQGISAPNVMNGKNEQGISASNNEKEQGSLVPNNRKEQGSLVPNQSGKNDTQNIIPNNRTEMNEQSTTTKRDFIENYVTDSKEEIPLQQHEPDFQEIVLNQDLQMDDKIYHLPPKDITDLQETDNLSDESLELTIQAEREQKIIEIQNQILEIDQAIELLDQAQNQEEISEILSSELYDNSKYDIIPKKHSYWMIAVGVFWCYLVLASIVAKIF